MRDGASAPTLLHVFPGFEGGGAQLRTASILNSLGNEFQHRIIAINGNRQAAGALDRGLRVEFEAAPARSGPMGGVDAFRRVIRHVAPDVVITYNWGAMDAVIGARLAGATVIHNECGFGADEAEKLKRRRVWTRRIVLRSVFETVVTSSNMLRIARSRFAVPEDKVRLIRTGVDVNRYQPGRNAAGRESMGLAADAMVFGYVGGLRPEKNLPLMIRAFCEARVPGSRLLLVGDGPCQQALADLARTLGAAESVIFTGHVSDPLPYLLTMDAFAMSSATEQTSNAMLEAMACGLPVVCTDVGDSRELLGPTGEACVVPNGDSAALSARLRELANPERRAALGAANRARAVTEYAKERMVAEYAALYRAALKRPRGAVKWQPRPNLLRDTTPENDGCPR